jgi:hypothetical protein
MLFEEGGVWSWIVTLLAVGQVALLVTHFIRIHKTDLSPLLWGLLASMLLFGLAGTLALVRKGAAFIGFGQPGEWGPGVGVMVGAGPAPLMLAMGFGVFLAIATGVAAWAARRTSPQPPASG